ncbi:MAG: outer membrane lipoprotein carrier protein LolA [Bacteroidetes bacterium]|nr:outer membrane lipoprotein carrier protein LolA [Bacteroidota bacterium]
MKKILLIAFALNYASAVVCQETDKGDKKSNEILDRLTQKTEAYQTIKTEFSYLMKNAEAGVDEKTEGTLYVKGDKYRLVIAGQIVICDGTTIWTYIKDADEIQINAVENSEESITPNKLLTSYNKDYKSKFVKETFQYGTTVNIVDLTPIEGKTYSSVRVIIDKAKDQLLEITIFDKNGSTYSYLINKFEPNVTLNDSQFTYTASEFPGAEVIDMR